MSPDVPRGWLLCCIWLSRSMSALHDLFYCTEVYSYGVRACVLLLSLGLAIPSWYIYSVSALWHVAFTSMFFKQQAVMVALLLQAWRGSFISVWTVGLSQAYVYV